MNNKEIKISVLTSLYHCESFLSDYLDALAAIEGKEKMEVLLLHNAPTDTELEMIQSRLPELDFVRHIIIPDREGLYSTWNRGIQLSLGEYITVWNVDDVRFPNSVLQQAEALDKNPQAAIAYGDIWVSRQYAITGTFKTNSPVYSNSTHKRFLSQYHISCFQMWRKSIHETIGYYDEQFKCVADFDFQIRAALHFPFVKTEEPLGIYLEDQPHKLSYNGLQSLESNIIYLRYGSYKRLNVFELHKSKKMYRKNKLLFFDQWIDYNPENQFSTLHKGVNLFRALFSSSIKLAKQITRKILYGKEHKKYR
jgi:glycosyltransferase involved in cell wall biosynthesis